MIYVLDLCGTAVFAFSGALMAGRRKMDLFGILVIATVTAVGGGTVRDLVLGVQPVFWVADTTYLVVAIIAGLAMVVLARTVRMPQRALLWADATGLAIFTVIGCDRAVHLQASGLIVVLMGVVTGVVGGMLRDVLSGEVPLVLRREVYATACIVGGVVHVGLAAAGALPHVVTVATLASVLAIRLAAIRWHLSLPVPATSSDADVGDGSN